MKILITGFSGTLGESLYRVFTGKHEVIGTDLLEPGYAFNSKFIKLDFTDTEETYEKVSKENPDLIIHAGAYTDVDGCEENPRKAYSVNAFGTRNLLTAAIRYDAVFLYISTDHVFDGKKRTSYMENDEVKPVSVYAKSKYWGESFTRDICQKYFIIRTSWLYGLHGSNFAKSIYETLKKGGVYKAARDITASPTFADDLASAIGMIIETKKYGLYHITNSGSASRQEFAEELKKLMGAESSGSVDEVDLKFLNLRAFRPAYSVLNNFCYENEGFGLLRGWKEALSEFVLNIK